METEKINGVYHTGGKSAPTTQKKTMPAPSEALFLANVLYQYTGTTNEDFTFGYYYKCVSDGAATPTYSWERTNVQPSGSAASGAVVYDQPQTLTNSEKAQARDNIGAGEIKSIISKTYAELAALKSGGSLVAGQWYRITDYVTTTNMDSTLDTDTSKQYKSAGHAFDVIVMAKDASHFAEDAYAALHTGDTYFSKSNLNAWKLKYSFDNDSARFNWADTVSGKGVIYRLQDEFGNYVAYDFKNIQFKRFKVTAVTNAVNSGLVGKYIAAATSYGVTYDNTDYVWCYTFTYCNTSASDQAVIARGLRFDLSLYYDNENVTGDEYRIFVQAVRIDYNKAGTTNYRSIQALNNNVFINRFVSEITIGTQSENNTLGAWDTTKNGCGIWTAASCFRHNIIYDRCCHNTFGSSWEYNTVGSLTTLTSEKGLSWNTFEESHFKNNLIGNDFYNNNVESNGIAARNVIGNGFALNNVSDNFVDNTFGNNVLKNTFGINVYDCTFGNNIEWNTIGNGCGHLTFGNDVSKNTVGQNCGYLTFGNTIVGNTIENGCTYMTFGNYVKYNNIEPGCSNITYATDSTGATAADGFVKNRIRANTVYVNIVCTEVADTKVRNYDFGLISGGTAQNRLVINVQRDRNYITTISQNQSGNIKEYCIADSAVDVLTSLPASFEMNKVYDLGVQTTLAIVLPSTGNWGDSAIINFLSGATPTSFSMTASCGMSTGDYDTAANKIYQYYVQWGRLSTGCGWLVDKHEYELLNTNA